MNFFFQNKKMDEKGIDDLPKFVLFHLISYFDFNSFVFFTSTNKKNRNLFPHLRQGFAKLKKMKFPKTEEMLNLILKTKDFSGILTPNICDTPIQHLLKNYEENDTANEILESIQFFVENKVDIHHQNQCYDLALHLALCRPDNLPKVVNYLVENKSDLNCINNFRYTPLFLAILNHTSLEIIKILIENKSDLNYREPIYQNTILHSACETNKEPEILLYLIESKCDLYAKNQDQNFALTLSVRKLRKR